MIISVVSGKGGAGKTSVATSLAQILAADYYDLDVDAPNGEHFLQPAIDMTRTVYVPQPEIDSALCTGCGACTQQCRFKAFYKIAGQVYLNEHLCHSCNLCREVCPSKAISYQPFKIGEIRSGSSARSGARVTIGDLLIGSTRGTSLISQIVGQFDSDNHIIIDGPPGNSCAAVAAVKPADLVVLVIEPTPFGIHDMLQTLKILRDLDKPIVAIANKSLDDTQLQAVLAEQQLTLAASILLDEQYHKALLRGEILSQADARVFRQLEQAILPRINKP